METSTWLNGTHGATDKFPAPFWISLSFCKMETMRVSSLHQMVLVVRECQLGGLIKVPHTYIIIFLMRFWNQVPSPGFLNKSDWALHCPFEPFFSRVHLNWLCTIQFCWEILYHLQVSIYAEHKQITLGATSHFNSTCHSTQNTLAWWSAESET